MTLEESPGCFLCTKLSAAKTIWWPENGAVRHPCRVPCFWYLTLRLLPSLPKHEPPAMLGQPLLAMGGGPDRTFKKHLSKMRLRDAAGRSGHRTRSPLYAPVPGGTKPSLTTSHGGLYKSFGKHASTRSANGVRVRKSRSYSRLLVEPKGGSAVSPITWNL